MATYHVDLVTLKVGDGEIVVHLHRIAPSVFEYEVKTTAPGWGGLYGRKSPADERFANEYSATVAGILAARRYWLVKRHYLLVREIDDLLTDYCFDCEDATDTDQLRKVRAARTYTRRGPAGRRQHQAGQT